MVAEPAVCVRNAGRFGSRQGAPDRTDNDHSIALFAPSMQPYGVLSRVLFRLLQNMTPTNGLKKEPQS